MPLGLFPLNCCLEPAVGIEIRTRLRGGLGTEVGLLCCMPACNSSTPEWTVEHLVGPPCLTSPVSPIISSVPLKFMKQNLLPLALLDPVDAVWERW